VGAAWPRDVVPPPRKGEPSRHPDDVAEAAAAAGVAPALVDGTTERIGRNVMRAALALRAGNGPEAVRLQREARDLCLEALLVREAVTMELILGTYLVQLGHPLRAEEVYLEAAARAREAELGELAAQAWLALGALHLGLKRSDRAAAAYAEAGMIARDAEASILAIEAFRMTGQVALDAGLETQAVESWRTAIEIAQAEEAGVVKASSAAEVARALAAVCRRHGLDAQADALEDQSRRIEAGEGAWTDLGDTKLIDISALPG
jgi:tetratricopeptide (TPR) repeat protein